MNPLHEAAASGEAALPPEAARPPKTGHRAVLLLALLLALLARLGTASDVFVGEQVLLDGTDGYYHLRRAFLIDTHWPRVPQRDAFLGPPTGGLVQWPPLFDLLLAALARIVPAPREQALEAVGARLPVLLGIAQVLLVAAVTRRLAGRRAGAVAALLAAVLPAAVRHSLLGALDHDPAIEALPLLVLLPLASALREPEQRVARPRLGAIVLAALGLAALPLTWAGSVIHFGLFFILLVAVRLVAGAQPAARLGAVTAAGALAAVAVVAPFAAQSPWNAEEAGAFAGLSWLHVAALAGLASVAALLVLGPGAQAAPGARRLAWLSGAAGVLVLVLLAPRVLSTLVAGLRFLGKDEPFLTGVAEARPLLTLFGGFDLRPLLVRLSGFPLVLPLLLLRRGRGKDHGLLFVAVWSAWMLALALLQVRFSHGAALALAALGGVAWERLPRRGERLALAAALIPCLAAYVAIPGFPGQRFHGRPNDLVTTGMVEAASYLRAAAPPCPAWRDPGGQVNAAVLAPWEYGHWIHWLGRRATVANPFGPQGQSAFAAGARWWLLEDPGAAAELLATHRVRWVVVPTAGYPLPLYARLAGLDESRWLTASGEIDGERYLATVGARLAWAGTGPLRLGDRVLPPLSFLREVYRTRGQRRLPDGSPAPLLRVYEVEAGRPAAAL